LKEKSRNRKVRRAQQGLGPRLRGSRRMVGAMARFRAQRVIPRYSRLRRDLHTVGHKWIEVTKDFD